MLTGYEQSERRPGLHEINILALKEAQVWEQAFPVAAGTVVSVVRNPEAGLEEDMGVIAEVYMAMEVGLEVSRATSKIQEAVEPRVEAAETDSRSTMSMMRGLLRHQEADK
jgi:hypothetical protein